jgi:nitroreductase
VGGAAAYTVLRPTAAWARRIREAGVSLQPWALPAEPPAAPLDLTRALIGAAVLAPSDWNSQPWRFEADPGTIRLLADPQRALPLSDPDRRGMMVSLGAALENLLVAARAYGLQPTVRYRPNDGARGAVAEVTWTAGEPRRDRDLFGALTARCTNRRNFDGRGLMPQARAQLSAQAAEGPRLRWLEDRDALHDIADIAHDAVLTQSSDRRIAAELHAWLRSSQRDAARRGDGVPVEALGMTGPANWFSGRYYDPDSWFLRFGSSSLAKRAREAIRSAGAVALLTAASRDESAWVAGGQAYERLALKATQLGLALQPMNAPLESERFRGRVLRRFDAGGEEPLMLVRLGHDRGVPHTPRRAVSVVTSFRNS